MCFTLLRSEGQKGIWICYSLIIFSPVNQSRTGSGWFVTKSFRIIQFCELDQTVHWNDPQINVFFFFHKSNITSSLIVFHKHLLCSMDKKRVWKNMRLTVFILEWSFSLRRNICVDSHILVGCRMKWSHLHYGLSSQCKAGLMKACADGYWLFLLLAWCWLSLQSTQCILTGFLEYKTSLQWKSKTLTLGQNLNRSQIDIYSLLTSISFQTVKWDWD